MTLHHHGDHQRDHQGIHPMVAEVTARIVARSDASRRDYLARIRSASETGPARGRFDRLLSR